MIMFMVVITGRRYYNLAPACMFNWEFVIMINNYAVSIQINLSVKKFTSLLIRIALGFTTENSSPCSNVSVLISSIMCWRSRPHRST